MPIELIDSDDEPNQNSVSSSEFTSVDYSGTQINIIFPYPIQFHLKKSPYLLKFSNLI